MNFHHGAQRPETSGAPAGGTPKDTSTTPERQGLVLRSAEELAHALPYVLGYRPGESIVLVAVHDSGGRGTFGGRARLPFPVEEADWPAVADTMCASLLAGEEPGRGRPDAMVVYLSRDPGPGETPGQVMERLRPLAQVLRTTCGSMDVPVVEALCLSGGRMWSYCCPGGGCCPEDGLPLGLQGSSVFAAEATFAGLQVRDSLEEIRVRFAPWTGLCARAQEEALDAAAARLVPRIVLEQAGKEVAAETLTLALRVVERFAAAPAASPSRSRQDARDDALLTDDEAAALLVGLQCRTTRDRAAEWMEGESALPALRLWRALARRTVGGYREHAAAPLALAGWVAWSSGDELESREALSMALAADPEYTFARLLDRAQREGVDVEDVRSCLRAERALREPEAGPLAPADAGVPDVRDSGGGPSEGAGRTSPEQRSRPAAPDAEEGVPGPPGPPGLPGPDKRRPRSGEPRTQEGGRPGGGPAAPGKPGHRTEGAQSRAEEDGAEGRPPQGQGASRSGRHGPNSPSPDPWHLARKTARGVPVQPAVSRRPGGADPSGAVGRRRPTARPVKVPGQRGRGRTRKRR